MIKMTNSIFQNRKKDSALTCFLVHHVLFGAVVVNSIDSELDDVPLAEVGLFFPEKCESLSVRVLLRTCKINGKQ